MHVCVCTVRHGSGCAYEDDDDDDENSVASRKEFSVFVLVCCCFFAHNLRQIRCSEPSLSGGWGGGDEGVATPYGTT